jgi:hypothetical protein
MTPTTAADKQAFWESVARLLRTQKAQQDKRRRWEVRQNFGVKVRQGEHPTLFPEPN